MESEISVATAVAAVGLLVLLLVFAVYLFLFNPAPFEGFMVPDQQKENEKPRVE